MHAASWRSAYRGILSDDYLDTRVLEDRRALWTSRFEQLPAALLYVVVAETNGTPVGFACVMLDAHERWGSLLDNLHVLPEWKGRGLGKRLLLDAARWCAGQRPGAPLHLWVYEQNAEARTFYERLGAVPAETIMKPGPHGDAAPSIRYVWDDVRGTLVRS